MKRRRPEFGRSPRRRFVAARPHAAAEQLGFLKDIHGVEPLMKLLQNCEDRGVRIAAFAALRGITGMKLGRDEDAWRAWWTNHRDDLLPKDE
jgi:hypothetical protein